MENQTSNTVEAIKAQANYAKESESPHFAPSNGFCYSCGRDIYEKISVESAGKRLITGCPHCNRSYCA